MRNPPFENRIVVDWDGTCVELKYPEQPTEWMPGAMEALRAFLSAGYEVAISSTRLAPRELDETTRVDRAGKERERRYIRKMLDEAGLEDVKIWLRPWKPGALFYIDDKGIRYDGNWQTVVDVVLGR